MISKEELHERAKELGVNIEGKPWPQQIKAVNDAEQALLTKQDDAESAKLKQELQQARAQIKKMQVDYEGHDAGDIPDKSDYDKQPVMIAPEMTPHPSDPNLSRYSNEEKIGNDLELEEVSYNLDDLGPQKGEKKLFGSYRVKGKGNKVVTALSRGPRFQPGLYLHNEKNQDELFQEVTFLGEKAYLWSDVRAHLMQVRSGVYIKKYEKEIKENLTSIGHRLGINKEFTNLLIQQIEDEEQMRAQRGY